MAYICHTKLCMSDIKNRIEKILENINNTEDLDVIKSKVSDGFFEIVTEIENINNKLENIQNELYIEDSYDFEITCPYCNNEITIDYDEEVKEITCPECNNIIELDWSGDVDGDECSDGCSHCNGCHHEEE